MSDIRSGKIIVTGGAGFIGSCIVRMLNDDGIDDIVVVDNIASSQKWMNIRNKRFDEYVSKGVFLQKLNAGEFEGVSAIIHMGACSSTTETDFDYLWENNVEYSKTLWKYSAQKQIPFIYASSAATYGTGDNGFDDKRGITRLLPLNGYGYSKQAFDLWTLRQEKTPLQHVGLKFFNVFGPNEYCKGSMASMVYHGYGQIKQVGEMRLFRSYRDDYQDGQQLRDFVYVKDVCSVVKYFLDHTDINGIYNVGTGKARSFNDLAKAVFRAMDVNENIKYIEMPESLRDKYQYYTQADISKLREAGYEKEFMTLEDSVGDYVREHLMKDYEIY